MSAATTRPIGADPANVVPCYLCGRDADVRAHPDGRCYAECRSCRNVSPIRRRLATAADQMDVEVCDRAVRGQRVARRAKTGACEFCGLPTSGGACESCRWRVRGVVAGGAA